MSECLSYVHSLQAHLHYNWESSDNFVWYLHPFVSKDSQNQSYSTISLKGSVEVFNLCHGCGLERMALSDL